MLESLIPWNALMSSWNTSSFGMIQILIVEKYDLIVEDKH